MIRYGLMFSGRNHTEWQAQCLDALLAVEGAKLVVMIQARKDPAAEVHQRSAGGGGWRLLRKVEWSIHPPRAWAPCSLPNQVAEVPVMDCVLRSNDAHACGLAVDDIRAIEKLDLDFILAFLGYNILRGPVLDVARYGIWSYHHGDPACYRGAPPAVWEVYDGAPRTGAVLQRLTDRLDAGIVLRQGDCPTVRHSFYRNLDNILFKSAAWPAEMCGKLTKGDAELLGRAPFATDAPIRRAPNNCQALRLAIVLLWNNLVRIVTPWRRC